MFTGTVPIICSAEPRRDGRDEPTDVEEQLSHLCENARSGVVGERTDTIAPASGRDPHVDNARAILITLVVVGHLLEVINSYGGGAIGTWIYAFHMPAFVAISGYLARSYRNEPRQLQRLFSVLFVPYLLFQAIHATLRVVVDGDDFGMHLWQPSWSLWFLLALFFWRLATPLLKALRYPLVFAVAISVLAPLGPDLDRTLTWGRVLAFLPFFVLGLLARPEHLERLRRFRYKFLGYVVLAAGLALSFGIHERFSITLFYMAVSYDENGIGDLRGVLVRVLFLAAAAVAVLALLVITPQRRHWWTDIGKNSLTVYLLHGLIVYSIRDLGFMTGIDGPLGTVLVILAGVALTLLLSREWVARATRGLTNPPIGRWLLRETGHARHATEAAAPASPAAGSTSATSTAAASTLERER